MYGQAGIHYHYFLALSPNSRPSSWRRGWCLSVDLLLRMRTTREWCQQYYIIIMTIDVAQKFGVGGGAETYIHQTVALCVCSLSLSEQTAYAAHNFVPRISPPLSSLCLWNKTRQGGGEHGHQLSHACRGYQLAVCIIDRLTCPSLVRAWYYTRIGLCLLAICRSINTLLLSINLSSTCAMRLAHGTHLPFRLSVL